MPSPRKGEQQKDYISRCMSSEEAKKDFPDSKQRVAFCNSKWRQRGKGGTILDKTSENYISKKNRDHNE